MILITDIKEIAKYNDYILYFYADWIIEHKKMSIILDKARKKFDVSVLAINTDMLKFFAKSLDIESIPTCLFFKDKENLKKIEGVPLTQSFLKACADIYTKKEI